MIRGAAALLALVPSLAAAQEVTLRSGDMAVAGRLAAHDGTLVVIETEHGPLALSAAAVSCEGAACPGAPEIEVRGDAELVGVLMPALVEAFAERRGVAVERRAQGYRLDHRGDALLVTLRVDEGPLVWGPEDPGGATAPERRLAMDALVPVVSPRSGVGALSRDALAGLLAGSVTDWAELGAARGPVSLHVLAGRAEEALGAAGLELAGAATRHLDGAALMRAVVADPGALGLTTLGEVGVAEPLAIEGGCGVLSRPDADAVRAGDWPLALPVALGLPSHPLPRLAADLAAFATSPEAQPVIRRAGLLDHAPREVPLRAQGERLAGAILAGAPADALRDAVAELRGLTRLTTTFRFEDALRLDPASRGAAQRLADRIASGAHDGRRLVFVGFGDGRGPPDRTRAVSLERSRAVMEAVRARVSPRLGGPILSATGHGAALPVACDDTREGRRLNRRVELWID